MRDWRHVGDAGDLIATAVQSTDSGLTTWTWALNVNVKVFQAIFQRSLTSTFSSYLSSERGGLARTAETRTTGGSPRKRITLTVGDGHDCGSNASKSTTGGASDLDHNLDLKEVEVLVLDEADLIGLELGP